MYLIIFLLRFMFNLQLCYAFSYENSLYNYAQNPEKFREEEEENDETKERLTETDDPVHLTRTRAMDDWKDEHKRGEGNRHNMG